FEMLVPANKTNLEKARSFVNSLKPIGGTAISDALKMALGCKPSGNHDKYTEAQRKRDEAPYEIIFMTDGQPTIGETGEDRIVHLAKDSREGIHIFPFGIGTDINTH